MEKLITGKTMKKIRLEIMNQDHANKIVEWRNKPRVYKAFFTYSESSLETQLNWIAEHSNNNEEVNFVIILDTYDSYYPVYVSIPIGAISLYNANYQNNRAELGRCYIGDDSMLRKGYATEALKLVLNHAFSILNLNKVYLEIFWDNFEALRLYKKVGFTTEASLIKHILRDGKYEDILRMCIFKDEYVN